MTGGNGNTANGTNASVSGGQRNTDIGSDDAILGGFLGGLAGISGSCLSIPTTGTTC